MNQITLYYFLLWLAFIGVFFVGYLMGRWFQLKRAVKMLEVVKTHAYYQGVQDGRLNAQLDQLGYTTRKDV